MKRNFIFVQALLLTLLLAIGSAWGASEIDIRGDIVDPETPAAAPYNDDTALNGPVTVDTLWPTYYKTEIDFGGSATFPGPVATDDRYIGYGSQVAINHNSTLKFTMTNATIKANASLRLNAYDGAANAWITVATMNDFSANTDGNYEWVQFQVDTSAANADTYQLFTADALGAVMANNGALPADTWMVMSVAAGNPDPPTIVIAQGSTSDVTIQVTEAKDGASSLTAPLTVAETLITPSSGVSGKVVYENSAGTLTNGPATSTIDVNATTARTEFVDDPGASNIVGKKVTDGDTDLKISECGLIVGNTAEFGLTLDASDNATVSFTRTNMDGVTAAHYSGNAMTLTSGTYSLTKDFATVDLTNAAGQAVSITVNGTDVLSTGNWKTTLTIDPDTDANEPGDLPAITLLSEEISHKWTINGAQFIVPHMVHRADYSSWLVLKTMDGAEEGLIFVDMLARDGSTKSLTNTDLSTLTLETAANGGSRFITAEDLMTAAGWTSGSVDKDFGLTLTVTLPQAQVYCEGFKYNSSSTDMNKMTVYDSKTVGVDGGTATLEFVK